MTERADLAEFAEVCGDLSRQDLERAFQNIGAFGATAIHIDRDGRKRCLHPEEWINDAVNPKALRRRTA